MSEVTRVQDTTLFTLFPEYVVAVVAVRVLGRVRLENGWRAEVDAADLGAVREGILETGSGIKGHHESI